MANADPLAVLSQEERSELESLLMEFDQAWTPTSLTNYMNRLSADSRQSICALAPGEFVKIDLHRRWSSGQGKTLEEYCQQFPDLGSIDSLDPALVLAEFRARKSVDTQFDLESFAARFPKQMKSVLDLDAESPETAVRTNIVAHPSPQASIDTHHSDQVSDTKPSSASAANDLPSEFGRYRIIRELGAGAMGKVYLARDSQLDREVALKTPTFKGDKDDEFLVRFYREARAAAKLQHRNICPIFDVGEIDGRHFISMAFIKGRSMAEFISPEKLPPTKTSAILVHRLATALAEAHRHNVIHRDLKPANIMIDKKREPIVMDFGLARRTDTESQMTQSGMILGTPAYMAPEQLSGQSDDVGPAADIYALGVILYELLTGKLPFGGSIAQLVYQIVHQEPVAPSDLRSEVTPELEAICLKMMAKKREVRFQSMDQVARALKRYVKEGKGGLESESIDKNGPAPAPKTNSSGIAKSASQAPGKTDSGLVSESDALNNFFASTSKGSGVDSSLRRGKPLTSKGHSTTIREADLNKETRRSGIGLQSGVATKKASSFFASPIGWVAIAGGTLLVLLLVVVLAMMFRSSEAPMAEGDSSDSTRQIDGAVIEPAVPNSNESVVMRSTDDNALDSEQTATISTPTSPQTGGADVNSVASAPFSGALDGTTWSVRDSDGDLYNFYFRPGGVLHYESDRGRRVHGTWRRSGNDVVISTNGGYSNLTGELTENGIAGQGESHDGRQWTWQARYETSP